MTAPGFSRALAATVATALFMEYLDATIIQTAVPAIARDFGVTAADVGAAVIAYLLAVSIGIPASAWVADRFGVRRVFLASLALFTVASALCAAAPSLEVMIIGRLLQGAGGALMAPVGRYAVLRSTSPQQLLSAISYLTWPALTAPVLAPALGGFLTDTAGWRWIFLINIPIGTAAFLMAWIRMRPEQLARPPRFDLVGFALVALSLMALVVGAELVATAGWVSAAAGAAVLGAGIVISVIATRSLRNRPHPLLDLSTLGIRTFRAGNASGAIYRMVITAAPFVLTLQFQTSFGWSALTAGLAVMAVFAGNIAIKPLTTPAIRRWGFRPILIVSTGLSALLLTACATFGSETPTVIIIVILFAGGVFRSVGFSAYNTLQFADVPAAEMNNANTLSSVIQQGATAGGIALAILLVRAGAEIAAHLGATDADGFPLTYLLAASVMLVPHVAAIMLPHDAGQSASSK